MAGVEIICHRRCVEEIFASFPVWIEGCAALEKQVEYFRAVVEH
jgi:hypothetical protein